MKMVNDEINRKTGEMHSLKKMSPDDIETSEATTAIETVRGIEGGMMIDGGV
jgi:hypothetical protein